MDPQSKNNEPEGLRFYHLDLYDSNEDLELFSEEPFQRRDLALQEKRKTSAKDLAKSYHRDKDKETTFEQLAGTAPSSEGTAAESGSSSTTDIPKDHHQSIPGTDKDIDTYCITCCVPIRALDQWGSEHEEHEVIPLISVVEIAKDELHKNVCRFEDQIAHLENFSSHLEEIFITVEENFAKQEQNFERQYNNVLQTLEQKYEENMQALGEEKKEKLEALYEQLVSCGENLDDCKDLMETIEGLGQGDNSVDVVKEPNSATGTSVRVCWSFFSEDIVEGYQLYYKRVRNDTSKEEETEFMLNVKETYSTVINLAPNAQYEFWVRALNRAGIGPASERAVYMTAPLPPVIKSKKIQSCEHAALVCWESGNTNPVDSYTVELSQLTEGEDGNVITESIVGIPNCETLIQLEPRQNYLLSVKAMNMGGSSERSKPVCILSTGTSFTLNEETAHPALSVLDDGFTIVCRKTESPKNKLSFHENSFTRSFAILGDPIPFQGKHYWEVNVDENLEYHVGVAFDNVPRDSYLGSSHSSWCMRHSATVPRHTYEFLNNGVSPEIRITVPPRRIGLLLDYSQGTLSFFNTDLAQHLYTFHTCFRDSVCPCFALEDAGTLRIQTGIPIPSYVMT
ncbi:hypothetical protein lerEdw1_011013 [Lerista edwardsae]|nr:hypothetical protein lerEdw1_011013 [Lerista edwardsae]